MAKKDDYLELPVLPAKQQAFVDWIASGLTPHAAAKRAGYTNPGTTGPDLMLRDNVKQHIEWHQTQHRKEMGMTREKVQEGLLEAIEIAKELGDAGSMIRGWAEVARISGLNQPEKKEVDININTAGQVTQRQLRQLPTTQLLELVGQEVTIEDVEFEEIFDQDVH